MSTKFVCCLSSMGGRNIQEECASVGLLDSTFSFVKWTIWRVTGILPENVIEFQKYSGPVKCVKLTMELKPNAVCIKNGISNSE